MHDLNRRAFLGGLALAALPLSAARAAERLPVVASFSILGNFVAEIGGDRVAVTTLVGPDGDAHVYNPTPADAKAVAGAKLVFINGLGFEGWMERLARASGGKAQQVVATKGIAAQQMEEDGHLETDPHAWQSVANAKIYAANIRDALISADPGGKAVYEANASAYLAKLDVLEAEVKAAVATIAADRRKVITTHDAFGYFAKAYGVTFLAAQGVSTESEASPKQVAKLIRQIKAEGIRAVFVENMSDARMTQRIAKETGAVLGGALYADALSPSNGPAATYIAMMTHNTKLLAAAMAGA